MNPDIKIGKYRHFKGDTYYVINTAKYSEDIEKEFVIYYHEGEPGKLWVRPIEMWNEIITKNGYNGPRFTFIED